ncbi:MAG: Glycosyltransferase involved in cell wall bisynthesis [Methanophagales archaeon]|nr:glycosyltransferase family 4 protein [Methanophagales archaeon]MCU4139665.1 Glycosyltransferase involved in cell wall bisynthesis [Methanophagales archaeon]
MKIAFVYDAVYPWIKGGAEKRIYEIGKRLADKGHEVHWYGIGWWFDGNNGRTIDHDGIILHGVCEPMQLYVDGRRSIKEAIYFAEKLLPKLVRERFDVIDCQEFPYFPCFTAKVHSLFRRTSLVITWHEIWDNYWFEYLGKKGLFGWIVERLTARLISKNIAVSERTKKDLESLGVKNVKVIHNGIDFKKIESVKPSEEESDIVFAGRLIKDKNVDVLIKAISLIKREISDIKCIIIGDGPEKEKLMKLAKELRVENNVKFVGFLENHDDVIAYMKSSKVFVLPSTREGFGIVALEANACGLPVVTVNHGRNAACDFINGENGFVCELSAEDIAEKVLIGLEIGKIMRRKCIENAMRYDWDRIAKKCEGIYRGF